MSTDEHLDQPDEPTTPGDADDWWGDEAPTERAATSNNSMRNRLAGGIGALAIGAAAVFGINAATSSASSDQASANGYGAFGPGGMGRRGGLGMGTAGTISTIDGAKLTVKNQAGGTTEVSTTSSTTVTTVVTGALGDVAVGDRLMVIGTTSNGTVAATRIIDQGDAASAPKNPLGQAGPPGTLPGGYGGPRAGGPGAGGPGAGGPGGNGPGGGGPGGMNGAGGTVKSINGDTITLTTNDGSTVKVTTSSSTVVSVVKQSSVSALAVGDPVVVIGKKANGVVTATAIREGDVAGARV